MVEPGLAFPAPDARSGWLRLRTLILLRWLAVAGQTAAVLVATFVLGIRLPHLAVAAGDRRLGAVQRGGDGGRGAEPPAQPSARRSLSLLFDLCQLGTLLYLTGGLGNPFALLDHRAGDDQRLGADAARDACCSRWSATVIITLLAGYSVPLRLASGEALAVPPVLAAGTWIALVIGTAFLAIYARRVAHETFAM